VARGEREQLRVGLLAEVCGGALVALEGGGEGDKGVGHLPAFVLLPCVVVVNAALLLLLSRLLLVMVVMRLLLRLVIIIAADAFAAAVISRVF